MSTPANRSLSRAKAAKEDEFYTQYVDIEKEVTAYLEFDGNTFLGKVVYCNCDDPFESNFFKYFAANFNRLGLRKLISTSYDGSPIAGAQLTFGEYDESTNSRQKPVAVAIEIEEVNDLNGDGATGVEDVKVFLERNPHTRTRLAGGGDFRSPECIALLRESDVVVTNPPFSLFKEYVSLIMEHGKKFLIVGPKSAITYKEIFPFIRKNSLWLGSGFSNGNAYFSIPSHLDRSFADGVFDESTGLVKFRNVGWFTNLDHGRRHERIPLMTLADNLRFSKHKQIKGKVAYERYENFDAIEVPYVDAIPSDFGGIMGVPITFLDRYDPDQFEIVANGDDRDEMQALGVLPLGPEYVGNAGRRKVGLPSTKKAPYKRILIRHRNPKETDK